MKTLEQRLHDAMIGMAGNESLAGELDEHAANDLLEWGKSTLKQVVEKTNGMDDDAAENFIAPRLRALRMLMRAMGRWVGESKDLDAETRAALWTRAQEQGKITFGESFVLPPMEQALGQSLIEVSNQQLLGKFIDIIEDKKPKG